MLPPESIVIVHLGNPTEKFWGVLLGLDPTGLFFRGIGLTSFDSWVLQIARGESNALDLSSMFVPMARVERVFLDEQVGEVESYCQRFQKTVGEPVARYLGLAPRDDAEGRLWCARALLGSTFSA